MGAGFFWAARGNIRTFVKRSAIRACAVSPKTGRPSKSLEFIGMSPRRRELASPLHIRETELARVQVPDLEVDVRVSSLVVAGGMVLTLAAAVAAQTPAQIDRGKQVYGAQKCAMCHSIEGKGNPRGKLDGVGAKISEADMRKWMVAPAEMSSPSGRKPEMKPYKLPAADLDALVAYMMSLKS